MIKAITFERNLVMGHMVNLLFARRQLMEKLLMVVLFMVWTTLAFAQNPDSIPFAPAVNYGAGSYPHSVFCADLDGDTDLDLAVGNHFSSNVSILKNNGDGTFQSAVNYGAGDSPASVFCADLDGDGDLDLAVANFNSDNVSILKNNGDGTFQPKVDYGTGLAPKSVFCSDLDGDGDLDLAVANNGGGLHPDNTVSILKNNGNGTFQPKVNYVTGYSPASVFCADLDGDTDLDLAVAKEGTTAVSILKNNGDGTFQTRVDYGVGYGSESVFCADLDRDGDLDLAVVGGWYSPTVYIFMNNGNGTFQNAVNYWVGNSLYSVFCADLDGDNDLDLAVAGQQPNYVSILKNNGNGTFQSAVNYGAGTIPASVFCADLDGDNDLDLAAANNWSNNVSILKNLSAETPTAVIDNITPSPAGEGQPVTFSGHGADADGNVIGCEWKSSINGLLSNHALFTTSTLSVGTHTISFRVQDDDGHWSEEVSQQLEIMDGPDPVVEGIQIVPPRPDMSSAYIINVDIRNPCTWEREIDLTLMEADRRLLLGNVPWDLGGNYPEQATDVKIVPADQMATLSFKLCPTWNWIDPWDWTTIFSSFLDFAPLVGLEIPNDITVINTVLNSSDIITGQVVEFRIDGVSPSPIQFPSLYDTVRVPFSKVLLLVSSCVTSYFAGYATMIGLPLWFCPEGWFALAAEVLGIVEAQLLYVAASDPDSNYTVIVTPEFPALPELDTLPQSPGKQLAYVMDSIYAYSEALAKSYGKYKGAELDTAYYWESQQLAAACGFASHIEQLIANGRRNTAEVYMSRIPLDSARVAQAHDSLVAHGLPEVEVSILSRLGISPESIDSLTTGLIAGLENAAIDTTPSLSNGLRGMLNLSAGIEAAFRTIQFDVKINKMGEPVQTVSPDTIQYLENLSLEIDNRIAQGIDDSTTWVLIDSLHLVSLNIANASNDTTVLRYYRKSLKHTANYYDTTFNSIGLPPPLKPAPPTGPTFVFAGESHSFSSVTSDPDTDQIYYMFDWDDGMSPLWLGPLDSSEPCTTFHSWSKGGVYGVKVKACDTYYHVTDWSDSLWVTVRARGDANGDGVITAADIVYLINYLFISGPAPDPIQAGDVNCDGTVNASDVVYLINYLFISGPPPGC